MVSTPIPAAPPVGEAAPLRLPLELAELTLNLQELVIGDMKAEALTLGVAATAERITLAPLSLRVNGAPISLSADVDLSVPGFEYALKGVIEPLQVAPLVNTFAPAYHDILSGIFQLDFDVKGLGTTGVSLQKHLQGHLHVLLDQGLLRWGDLEQFNNRAVRSLHRVLVGVVRAAAPAMGLSPADLLNPPLEELRVRARMGSGTVEIETLRVASTALRMSAAGRIRLEEDMDASRFLNIPITLALSQDLARAARLFREDRVRAGMVELPSFVEVRGTLGQPDIDVRRNVITGIVAGGLVEGNLIRDERTRQRLDVLGGILTGEGPRPTPTPLPPGETRPTPTPAPPPTPTPGARPSRTDRVLRGLDSLLSDP